MKITLILPHADFTGGVRVVATYAEHLKKRGHEVCVVSRPYKRPTLLEQVKSVVKGQGVIAGCSQPSSHLDGLEVEHNIIDDCRPITDADVPDADVVVATWWETAEWVANLSPSKGAKAYFIQHHEIFDYLPRKRVEATYLMPLHKITISKWLLDLMQTKYDDRDVSLVLNSVDTEKFYAPPRKKQSAPTVGMLYAPTYWKGCDVSLKAFSLAAKSLPNINLVAFGVFPLADDLPLPANAQYFYKPPQNEIRDIYASCDVWLCGSRSEGFHLPPLEAMACRCPVVSTRIGGPLDIVEEGVNGYLVDIEDSNTLAEKLIEVLTSSEDRWHEMSDAAYFTATHYTWDDATSLFEAALCRAIERSKQGSLYASV